MVIPKIIYITHKVLSSSLQKYSVDQWQKLNPGYTIKCYDDAMCKEFLKNEFSVLYEQIWDNIKDGFVKSHFWRACILYKYGGIYVDADVEPLVPLANFLNPHVQFATCSSYWDGEYYVFNPHFIACEANNPVFLQCINMYFQFSQQQQHNYEAYRWSLFNGFTQYLKLENYKVKEGLYKDLNTNNQVQIIQEMRGAMNNPYDAHNIYEGQRVFNNRRKEWDYQKHDFIPIAETVVVDQKKKDQNLRILTVQLQGSLYDKMYQIAFGLGMLARYNHLSLCFQFLNLHDNDNKDFKYFLRGFQVVDQPHEPYYHIYQSPDQYDQYIYYSIPLEQNIVATGFFRSMKYFHPLAYHTVYKQFKAPKEIYLKLLTKYPDLETKGMIANDEEKAHNKVIYNVSNFKYENEIDLLWIVSLSRYTSSSLCCWWGVYLNRQNILKLIKK